MKNTYLLLCCFIIPFAIQAQPCTNSGFDICRGAITTNFKNGVQISGTGTPLSAGAVYKFANAIPGLNLDAVISIDDMVNATMTSAITPTIDNDAAADENGISGSQSQLFAPRIAPNQSLSCYDISGYVEFTLKFYTHYQGNTLPTAGTEVAISNLNFLQFNLDGSNIGNNGWIKKFIALKLNGNAPAAFTSATTELTQSGNINGWLITNGSTTSRNGIANCTEVISKAMYFLPQTAFSFRMGYQYKAPAVNCTATTIQPTLQFGAAAGCLQLPSGGPLPVSLTNVDAVYNNGKAIISWTSLQEHELDSYEIQRSTDGINYEVAGYIKANNLTTVQQYDFADDVSNFTVKNLYYRIRIIDREHSMKLTGTVWVKITESENRQLIITPNPASGSAQAKINCSKAGKGTIHIFNAAGQLVLQQNITVQKGSNAVLLNNITLLTPGYYTVTLLINDETRSSKLLIWN
ncbi:MAG: T9SS type A sorting domain-containing protein [Ferruginibacter sp.]